jgi:DNA-binding NarL/FixJ family response regulator
VHVVREARDGAEVGAAVERLAPDVVLMDIRMPGVDGLAATEALRAAPPASCSRTRRRLIEHVADDGLAGRRAHARELMARLTDREREVAVAIGQGKSNAEIYMSVATVKAHVTWLLQKLELDNPVQVALLAHDAGAG